MNTEYMTTDNKIAGYSIADIILNVFIVLYPLSIILYAHFVWDATARFGAMFLGGSLVICIINNIRAKGIYHLTGKRRDILMYALVILSLVTMGYFYLEYMNLLVVRIRSTFIPDYIMAVIALYLIVEFTRKTMGWILFGMVIIFWAYAFLGPYLPGILHHPGLDFRGVIQYSVLELGGIFGTITQVIATWVAIFVIWASLVLGFHGTELIMKAAQAIVRKSKHMLAQIAVLASMVLGMFSGSAAGNAAGTGSFTIPLMKRYGIPARIAAGIESVSSSAGQVMPPIMGAAAFLMADFLGMYYFEIVLIGFCPAIIFYICAAVAVYFISRKYLSATPVEEEDEVQQETTSEAYKVGLYDIIPIITSFATLIYLMGVLQMGILLAGFWTIVSFLVPRLIVDLVLRRGRASGFVQFGKGLMSGFSQASNTLAPIGVLGGALGIVVGTLSVTGLGVKISAIMVDTAGDSMILLMILVMIVGILFGMAVGTVATYVLVIILAAPALLHVGISPVCSHFAVFYCAMLSAITPPVAVACVVTAGIAKASFFSVCREAMRIGSPLFILPFVFMTRPELLALSSATPLAIVITLVGMIGITMGLNLPLSGWQGTVKRVIYIALGGIGLFYPIESVAFPCLGIVLVFFIIEMLRMSKGKEATAENV